MLAQQHVQDITAGNLANINTAGYKQDVPVFRELVAVAAKRFSASEPSGSAVGHIGLGAAFDGTVTDMSRGTVTDTTSPLDLALLGDGFFAVQTPDGERYTRAGHFRLQPSGRSADGKPMAMLIDDAGNPVLGTSGPIGITEPTNVTVASDGTIASGGKAAGRLKIVSANPRELTKEGGGLYSSKGAVGASAATVRSGCVEQSNVNPVRAMVMLVSIQRAYDAAQRAVVAQDETLGKAVNDLPRR